ncbi:3-ketoacyl-ACP reductase [Paenibacillus sp. NFR01]|uniref:3-ketoacyl-ACP reductase n=1 Tax=Paenibacillus sp. NFR01 TaxID=1566279 RepID=UPI0008B49818|nr:3-ketoacyl-ACP reductase [Paenibacillus sp. NFR01]SEU02184.1 3-oxoacyl-[acyl-carrier protein] reductase [Paenibacillus sp. NFR01]
MAQSLKGKTAIVTGAARGIGKATAVALATEGVNVGLLARTEASLQGLAAELKALGVNVAYAVADISSKEQVEAAIAKLNAELGPADILINNAGIATFGTVLEMDPEEWKGMIDTNLMGTYYVTRAVLPQLIAKNGGDIINISSTNGLSGAATSSAYSASKFAVIGFTESLAQEVRRNNIRVSALTPSTIATDLALELNLIKENNDSKFVQPEDVAEFIIDQLKINPRMYVKTASMIATNPF